jgi:hypothetical protein
MCCRLRRVLVMASIVLLAGVGWLSLTPPGAQAAPLDQYGCWGGPCPPAPGPWSGPPDPGAYADAVALTGYANLTNAIAYQNVVNAVTYQNLANATAYDNTVRVITYLAATGAR